jgi:branched-chain amino acid transport system permease protein
LNSKSGEGQLNSGSDGAGQVAASRRAEWGDIMDAVSWVQLIISGIAAGSVYALVGLGFTTIYQTSRVVNFAQGSFVMLGAIFAYSFISSWGLPFWAAGLLSIVGVVLVSLLMYRLVIAPLLSVSLVSMVMVTIGLSLFFENVTLLKWGGYNVPIPPFTGSAPILVGGVAISRQVLWVVGLTALVVTALYLLNNRTRVGKRMRATASNPFAASLVGISPQKMVFLAFTISASIGAIGGLAIGSLTPVSFAAGGIYSLKGFVAAIFGGWGSTGGAVVGGFAIGIIEAVSIGFLPSGYKDAVSFVVLLLVLYLRPQGLLKTPLMEGRA